MVLPPIAALHGHEVLGQEFAQIRGTPARENRVDGVGTGNSNRVFWILASVETPPPVKALILNHLNESKPKGPCHSECHSRLQKDEIRSLYTCRA
ncbi:uncharacterized protein ARMOST_06166 [Armillaria ostoyae]|uniref:Uncharacterized protein n=1 Tax=Armillaria ostoyae TaxID=47428 RepID=A0A284R297_ARMOS|nr:uncharacterized protein ARMOST_06166 [Armillaria ostoyae]